MQSVFGVPVGTLAVILAVAFGTVIALVVALAVRNWVFVRLGIRNARRRRARTVLIVVGLMLGTAIISSALGTGDTISRSMRSSVTKSLGETDELVSVKGTDTKQTALLRAQVNVGYFDETHFAAVRAQIPRSAPIDGLAPAIIEPVAVQDTARRQNEPRVTLFGADPSRMNGFAPISDENGRRVGLGELGAGRAYLNRDAADKLDARPGDKLLILAGSQVGTVTVERIVAFDGSGTDGAAVLMPLGSAQALLGRQGQINHVLVSNDGGVTSGSARTSDALDALRPVVRPLGLEAEAVKRDGLDVADEQGQSFMSLFTTFGTFSIAAGILLIFLIFVMLASERRSEMGIARAIGTQRKHLIETFLFEGFAYDLAASAVGAALGVGIAYVMVSLIAQAFSTNGSIDIQHDLRVQSLVVAYTLGVLITFAVVTISAWRVSKLNIVTATRNLPDAPAARVAKSRAAWITFGFVAGVALAAMGAGAKQATPFMLGVSIVVISAAILARSLGVSERVAYSSAGLLLVVWWLLPFSVLEAMLGDMTMDFSIWVTGGLMVVLGATWTVMYNADLVLAGLSRALRRVRSVAPVLKIAVAYPLRSRFRTGTTLAMFTLVVFTLVVGATTSGAFISAFNDERSFGGGFDVRAEVAPFSPVSDMPRAIASTPHLRPSDYRVVAAQSFVTADARQVGSGAVAAKAYALRGLDDQFLDHTTFELASMANGYRSARDVWRAVAEHPGLAVVDASVVPRRRNWGFAPRPEFGLHGFTLEDAHFAPPQVEVSDPQTGNRQHLTVIGVLKDSAPYTMTGISTSQRTLASFGARAEPTIYYFRLAPGLDADRAAKRLESAFLNNGMQAESTAKTLHDAVGGSLLFQRLLLGFLGLGLVVGVAALAVVSARSVVERRQQIGVLRAIGFQRKMIRLSLLLEASFVAVVAIGVGTALGLLMALNVIEDARRNPNSDTVTFAVPWVNLVIVFGVVYLAALVATSIPARKAARVYPAEALRYE